jgi:hypothetical protein
MYVSDEPHGLLILCIWVFGMAPISEKQLLTVPT